MNNIRKRLNKIKSFKGEKSKSKNTQNHNTNNFSQLNVSNPYESSTIINAKTLKFNYTIDDTDIYRAVKNGDKDFFFLSRMQSKTILDFRYMKGTCFHLAVKFLQPQICQILVILFGFGMYIILVILEFN